MAEKKEKKPIDWMKLGDWFAQSIWHFFDKTLGDFFRHEGLMYAGALSFFALFSFAPMLVIVASIIGYLLFFVGEGQASTINTMLNEFSEYGRQLVPYLSDSLESDLFTLVQNRFQLSLFGFGILLLSSSQLFRVCEFALGRIFHETPEALKLSDLNPLKLRNFFMSKVVFGVFVTGVAVVLIVLELLVHVFFDFLNKISPYLGKIVGDPSQGGSTSAMIFSLLSTIVIFALIVKMSTRRRIGVFVSCFGGLLFYFLVTVMGKGYKVYVDNIFQHADDFYGSMGAIFILMLWIYCLSVVFLISAEVVKYIQFKQWKIERN